MIETLRFLPILLTSYLLNSFLTYLLASKAGHTKPWISFIPFGGNHIKVELANLKAEVFTPASILYSTLSLLFLLFHQDSLIPYPILAFMLILSAPMLYIHWKLLEAYLLPGYLSILFFIPYAGVVIYLLVMIMSGVRTAQFYVGND